MLLSSPQPLAPAGTPLLISRTLLFPYLEGMSFVATLYRDGGWAAVDRVDARPPTSTAEILHPDRYLTGWTPTPLSVPSLGKVLDGGWTPVYLDTLRGVTFQVWLDQALDASAARRLAADWTDDQVVGWGGPFAGWVIAWRSTWATMDSALALASVADRLLAVAQPADRSPVHAERVTGTTVILLLESDRATLDRVSLALGG